MDILPTKEEDENTRAQISEGKRLQRGKKLEIVVKIHFLIQCNV